MSKYGEFSTQIKDGALLCDALEGMGFTIEAHAQPVALYGHHGDERPEKANVIIRRHNTGLGASNDIGFVRGADGCFQAIISEYDRGVKFNDSWLGKLKQGYTEQRQMQVARNKGYVFQGREVVTVNGREEVKLRCSPVQYWTFRRITTDMKAKIPVRNPYPAWQGANAGCWVCFRIQCSAKDRRTHLCATHQQTHKAVKEIK